MKIFLTLSIFAMACITTTAQNLNWISHFGGTSYTSLESVTVSANSNVISIGQFENTVDFDETTATLNRTAVGGRDIFIKCVDSNNNLLWANAIGGTSNELPWQVITDNQNDIYVIGMFSGTVDFDPSNSIVNLTSNGAEDIFLCKFTSLGGLIWAKSFGGTQNDFGREIVVNQLGEIYMTGWFRNTISFLPGNSSFTRTSAGAEDGFICKLNSNGLPIWVNTYGSNTSFLDRVYSVVVDHNNDLYISGTFGGMVDFDESSTVVNLSSAGQEDAFLVKLNNNGNFQWAESWGGSDEELALVMRLGNDSNLVVGGSFRGTTDLDPSTNNLSIFSQGSRDIFISKFTPSGNLIWGKSVGSASAEVCFSLELDKQNNIFASGYYFIGTDFDPGPGITIASGGGNVNGDGYLLKLNSNGIFNWVYTVSTSGADATRCVAIDKDDNIYLGGKFASTFDFDPSATINNRTSFGVEDAFLVKFDQCTQTDTSFFTVACNSYNSPSGTYRWTTSGTYTDTLVNIDGCDSVLTITLFVTNQNNTVTQNGFTLTSNATNSTYQWLDCNNNNAAITGETNASFTATQNGDYAVEITENGCKDTSACIMILGVGIAGNDIVNESFIVSPNPSNGDFNIQFVNSFNGELDIFNSIGQSIYREVVSNNNQIDISLNVSNGVYLVRLTTNQGEVSTLKVLVK